MNFDVVRGATFNGVYSDAALAGAVDWTGTVGVYVAYPGVATTVPLVLSGGTLNFSLSAALTTTLAPGAYYLVADVASASLGVSGQKIDTLNILTDTVVADLGPTCTIFATILKSDGTPAGAETKTLVSLGGATQVVTGWKGVKLTATNPLAYNIVTDIIGTESITTETNSDGYGELHVIQGLSVTVTCPAFGKTVQVDTTGLDTIDLSTFF